MDASDHLWFGHSKTQLHAAIDDASGAIVGLYFDTEETLNGYYNVISQVLKTHGIPAELLTDRRTIFEYKLKNNLEVASDTFTQFSYACHQLGITISTTSVPEGKGRIERLFKTLQSRLILELRLADVSTIEHANTFLKTFNKQFSLPLNNIKSVFETQPSTTKINQILSVISERVLQKGHCTKFKNNYYLPTNKSNTTQCFRKGTKCLVIQTFNQSLIAFISDEIFHLEHVLQHELISDNFDMEHKPKKTKSKYIPPMSHPWKHASFLAYSNSQKHRAVFNAHV